MKHPKNIKIISFNVVAAAAVLCITALPLTAPAAEDEPLAVGRDNPFAKISRPSATNTLVSLLSPSEPEKPQLYMQTVMLKFLDARSLKEAVEPMSSDFGTISINQTNNSLIICDTKERLEWILAEIEKADKTPQQIMVEVVIVDVQLNDAAEIGINWDMLSDEMYNIGYRQNFTDRLGSTVADSDTIGDATAFNTTGIGGNFSVISGTIRNVVAMLQHKRNVEIIASPRAMMVSGQSASIKAVEEIPYNEISDTAAGGAAAITTTKFKDVGVTLQVEGTITDGNNILLSIETEQNVRTGVSNTGVPLVDTRLANTSLMLKDGQIVVMGGLRRQEKTTEVDQIPILGDIPLIGLLFKYTNTVVRDTELIVFLSPHIYKEDEPIPDDAMEKFREIKEKPVLLLPEERNMKQYRDQLNQSIEVQRTAIEQLKRDIVEYEKAEDGLKEYGDRFDEGASGQPRVNDRPRQNINKDNQAEDELVEYNVQADEYRQKPSDANKTLQLQINDSIQAETELKEYHNRLKKRLEEKKSTVEKIRQEIVRRRQAERESAKKELFGRIKSLQNKNDENSIKELLATLASLDRILSEEIHEALDSSENVLAENSK